MNILILHSSSDLYGASKILLTSVGIFIRHNHRVTVVLSEHGPLADQLTEAGAEVVFIRLGILRRKYKSVTGMMNRSVVLYKAYRQTKKLIREKNISLVYSNTTAVLAGALAAHTMKVKHVWHIHEIIEKPKWLGALLGKMVSKYSERVIVVSEAVKENWSKSIDAEKIVLIHNGIDYSPYAHASDKLRKELNIPNGTIIIGMVGRVHYWKGQDYFLEIAAQLLKMIRLPIHFVMIGDVFPGYEYLYANLKKQVTGNNMEAFVTDLGFRTDVAALLQGFDIFVLPSLLPDPFPTVLLEAMASAIPVVATAQGGALEMIEEGTTGLLIPLADPYKASIVLERLIKDKSLRTQLGSSGRKKVTTDYSLAAFENKLIKVLE